MRLTERQRWNILRSMVKDKNEEYSSLLCALFDSEQMRQIVGFTRDTFLSKMGFQSLSEFNARVKQVNPNPSKTWLDNLSSEDLLLFLDFRCRFLQEIYDYFKRHNNITKPVIREIVNITPISKLKWYNYGRLNCTGKPEKLKGEMKLSELRVPAERLQNEALVYVLNSMIDKYMDVQNRNMDETLEVIRKIKTSNINLKGEQTGLKFTGKTVIENLDEAIEPKPKFVGLDVNGTPVYEYNGEYYTSIGAKVSEDEYIYKPQDDLNV